MFNKILLSIVNFRWKKNNQKNNIKLKSVIPLEMLDVGKATYGNLNIKVYDKKAKIKIGNYCSIADNVVFLVGGEHDYKRISTFPFQSLIYKQKTKKNEKNDIVVDDDVWIGFRSTILSGVHIGQGAIVAAGSVVTKDVPPYAIVGGVPAKVLKYRFSHELIAELLKVDYGKLTEAMVREHIDDLYSKLETKEQLKWMPQRIEEM